MKTDRALSDARMATLATMNSCEEGHLLRWLKWPLEAHAVVCAGAVERRYGLIVEPEVDAELGAVVYDVVEEHGAVEQ